MMPETPPTTSVSQAELAVLERLWVRGESPIRPLADDLYPGGDHAHYATVQSLLDRLEAKGCVRRRKEGRVNLFSAAVTRTELLRARLRDLAQALCEGSLAPLLSTLVRDVELDEEEARTLEALIERLDRAGEGER
jgi:predicted transcriptional regulator